MTGVITLRHVLAHPVTVVRGFGCRVLVRCVWVACRREKRTFLSIAADPDALRHARSPSGLASPRGRPRISALERNRGEP